MVKCVQMYLRNISFRLLQKTEAYTVPMPIYMLGMEKVDLGAFEEFHKPTKLVK